MRKTRRLVANFAELSGPRLLSMGHLSAQDTMNLEVAWSPRMLDSLAKDVNCSFSEPAI